MIQTSIALRGGLFDVVVLEGGSGPPVLFLHGIGGLRWDRFLQEFSADHRVVAPAMPGFGESTGSEQLSDIHDLVYFYLDLLDELGLRNIAVVGHSLGGMIAAELAAAQPERFTRVALIAPLGLWDPEHPVLDFFSVPPAELAAAMYYDQASDAAVAIASAPGARMSEVDPATEEGQAVIEFYVERAKSMSTAARYLWPIPDRGLSKRLHRISQPTLLVWGEADGICPPAYGADFEAALPRARLEIVPEAAHMAPAEQPAAVADLVRAFLVAGRMA